MEQLLSVWHCLFKVDNCHLGKEVKKSLPLVSAFPFAEERLFVSGATRAKLQMEQHILGSSAAFTNFLCYAVLPLSRYIHKL